MKKIFVLILAMVLAFSLVSCGDNKGNGNEAGAGGNNSGGNDPDEGPLVDVDGDWVIID